MNGKNIEPITEENWCEAASALCTAALTFENLLVHCLELHPESIDEVVLPHLEHVELMRSVVGHWQRFLEIPDL